MSAGPASGPGSVVIEADGGSRGNPGKAAYGAVLKEAGSGRVLAERAERIGVASNNVAEYRGLIAGLELYRAHADGAELEVRMDSKLVVEQMAGRWKVKHPSMRTLALEANRLAPAGTRWTWVPRDQNKHADRLANLALDGPEGVVHGGPAQEHLADLGSENADSQNAGSQNAGSENAGSENAGGEDVGSRTVGTGAARGSTTLVLVQDGPAESLDATATWLAGGLGTAQPVLLGTSGPRGEAAADRVAAALGRAALGRAATGGAVDGAEPATRVLDRLRQVHAAQLVVLVAPRELVIGLVSLALRVSNPTTLPVDLAPASVSVLEWSSEGAVVRLLGGLPRIAVPAIGTSPRAATAASRS